MLSNILRAKVEIAALLLEAAALDLQLVVHEEEDEVALFNLDEKFKRRKIPFRMEDLTPENQFGSLVIRVEDTLQINQISEEAREKIAPKSRKTFVAVDSVEVSWLDPRFRGERFGLLLYLKAIQRADVAGRWFTNDLKNKTSSKAAKVWEALSRYTNDYVTGTYGQKPLYAAKGLNATGELILKKFDML